LAPSSAPNGHRLLITVTGRDTTGITAALTSILAEQGATLHDIEQVVVQGQLTLCLLVGLPEQAMLKDLLFAAKEHGLALDFKPLDPPGDHGSQAAPAQRYVITAIGRTLGAGSIHAIAATLAHEGANIEKISRLSEGSLASLEVHCVAPSGHDPSALRRALLAAAMRGSFDVSLQRESLYRRSKRLVVMDMDSTLIRIEVIDELARHAGVADAVSKITERAMQGEMDYDESLRQRVLLLKGLDINVLHQIAAELPLNDGAETLIRVLKRLGYRIAIISGGFSVAAEALKRRLSIDYAYSNTLEVAGGKLTGRVVGPIVNGQRKAELLETIAQAEGVLLDQVIAVGDGANDLLMLERAGLGIAFHAKPKLREAADTAITGAGLDAILYLLGISGRELLEIEAERS
jgi:phosphoserine phosphatase